MQYFRQSADICEKAPQSDLVLQDSRLRRNADGVIPVARRKLVEKCCEWLKPDAQAMLVRSASEPVSRCLASSIRRLST